MTKKDVLLRPLRVFSVPLGALKGVGRLLSRMPGDKVLLAAVGLVGFGHLWRLTRRETVPFTQRRHSIIIPPVAEKLIGTLVFEHVKDKAVENRTLLPESHRFVKLVRRIGASIAQAANTLREEGSCGHMQGLQWEFLVVQSNDVNAFVLPGGKVVVFSGLIQIMNKGDELAAVLAHEVAHVVARHAAESLTELGILTYVQVILNLLCGLDVPSDFIDLFINLPHSRRNETEADLIGLRLMTKAGFNPTAAVSMLRKLEVLEKRFIEDDPSPFLRTHPIASDRIECVQKEISNVMLPFSNNHRRP